VQLGRNNPPVGSGGALGAGEQGSSRSRGAGELSEQGSRGALGAGEQAFTLILLKWWKTFAALH